MVTGPPARDPVIIWEEPPPATSQPVKAFLLALLERPGEWGKYPHSYVRRDMHSTFRRSLGRLGVDAELEIRAQRNGDGRWHYWVKVHHA